MSTIIYRIQDADGRGPWKPGFSDSWVEDRPEADFAKLVPWFVQFGPVHLNAKYAMHVGCGCVSPDQLKLWFTPGEYHTLQEHGYEAVSMGVGRILAESDIQCVFERIMPLNKLVESFELYG